MNAYSPVYWPGVAVASSVAMAVVWLRKRRPGAARRVERLLAGRAGGPPAKPRRRWPGVVLAWPARIPRPHRIPIAALAAGSVGGLWSCSPVPVALALPVAFFLRRRQLRAMAVRDADIVRRGVGDLCAALAAEVRAGRAPEAALVACGDPEGPIGRVVAEAVGFARVGGDVPAALERAASVPGAEGLRRLAACWRIVTAHGAGPAPALDRIAEGLRAEEDAREEVRAEVAGARATARLVACLPGFGVVLGAGLGADPVEVLLRTPAGVVCLVTGLSLLAVGLEWTDRMVAAADPVRTV